MILSNRGLGFIAGWEDLRLSPYYDEEGYPTIGYGHLLSTTRLAPLTLWSTITEIMAINYLHDDVNHIQNILSSYLSVQDRDLPTTQEEFDALTSLGFNIGWTWMRTSTILRMHVGNKASPMQIESAFCLFDKILGDDHMLLTSNGLLRRRHAEADVYLRGIYKDANGNAF